MDPTMQPVLEVRDLDLGYNDYTALRRRPRARFYTTERASGMKRKQGNRISCGVSGSFIKAERSGAL
jgi:hypothetical protein